MIEHIRNLIHYEEWADAKFLQAWQLTPDAVSDREMLHRWEHVVAVQNAFSDVLNGNEVTFSRSEELPLLSELKIRSQSNHKKLKSLVRDYSSEDLAQKVVVPWIPNPQTAFTRDEALIQVVMHTQHHRAQNMTKLQTYGGKPGVLDWIVWIFKGKPEAKW